MQKNKYEALYAELLDRGEQLHESNKRRIRRGIILLIILPFVLEFMRRITDSDKIVFLIIWILIMFVVSAYLISVEYLDYSLESTLRDVTDTEAEFDELLPHPDLHERIRSRIAERRAARLMGEEEQAATESAESEAPDEMDSEESAVSEKEEIAKMELPVEEETAETKQLVEQESVRIETPVETEDAEIEELIERLEQLAGEDEL